MLIKNLTSKKQKLEVREISGEHREYDVYVEPNGVTELEKLIIIHPEDYNGIFDMGVCCCHKEAPVEVAPIQEEAPVVEEKEEIKEEEEETTVEESSEFICDICGAEFASARGLSAHKNKAHAE